MEMKKKSYLSLCVLWLLVLTGGITSQAAEKNRVLFENFSLTNEPEGNVTAEAEEEGTALSLQFQFAEEGFYPVSVFQNVHLMTKELGGLQFALENRSEGEVRMNLSVIDGKGKVLQVRDGCYVQTAEKGKKAYEQAENGCFALPAHFSGTVQVPFGVLAEENSTKGKAPDEVMGCGFVFVAEEGRHYAVKVSAVEFRNAEELPDAEAEEILRIDGAEKLLRPRVGESESRYCGMLATMQGEEREVPVTLTVSGAGKGISIRDGGWVCASAESEEEGFLLLAETADGRKAEKEVALYDSWTQQVFTDNGYDASLAKPEEIAPIVKPGGLLSDERVFWGVRLAGLLGTVLFAGGYTWLRKRERGKK